MLFTSQLFHGFQHNLCYLCSQKCKKVPSCPANISHPDKDLLFLLRRNQEEEGEKGIHLPTLTSLLFLSLKILDLISNLSYLRVWLFSLKEDTDVTESPPFLEGSFLDENLCASLSPLDQRIGHFPWYHPKLLIHDGPKDQTIYQTES